MSCPAPFGLGVIAALFVACAPPPAVDIDVPVAAVAVVDELGRPLCTAEGVCLLDFGDVVVGNVAAAEFFVENRGDAVLRLPRYVFSSGNAVFSVDGNVPREVEPGAALPVSLSFSAITPGDNTGALAISDEDERGGVSITLRARVVECGAASAAIRVVAVNGVDVDDGPDLTFFTGDTVVLAAEADACGGPAIAPSSWLLIERSPGTSLSTTGDRAVLTLGSFGVVLAILVDETGAVVASVERRFESTEAVEFSFVTGAGRLHVARDGLDWCSDDDCYEGHCDVDWGGTPDEPLITDRRFRLSRAGDGVYTAAVVVDEDDTVFLRVSINDQTATDVVRQLAAFEPHILARVEIAAGQASSLEIDDVSPQPGACF